MPQDYARIIGLLKQHRVEFIIIGGTAAIAQGVPIATLDLDICYRHTKDNCDRLAAALNPLHPTLRGAAPDLPFRWDGRTLFMGCNFTLNTDEGDIDLLGHIAGLGEYDNLLKGAVTLSLYGQDVLAMSLEDLVRAKKAAGRNKDKFHLIEIEATLRLRKKTKSND